MVWNMEHLFLLDMYASYKLEILVHSFPWKIMVLVCLPDQETLFPTSLIITKLFVEVGN